MTHALHQFAEVRPGLGDEQIPGVTEGVGMNASEAGHGECGQPHPAAEVAVT